MIIMYLLLILVIFLLINAVLFKPVQHSVKEASPEALNEALIVKNFSRLIQHKTVSHLDSEKMDMKEFEAFQKSLETLYPKVHETCDRNFIGPTGILYKWKGKSSDKPIVLMSHYDVVPADEESWDRPPFSGEIKDGVIWGRGTIDTKITLLSIMESAEYLINQEFVPANDIYFSFAGDEEVSGPSAQAIVSHLKSKHVKPAMVLDEGGVIIEGIFPGVDKKTALIGLGEKGYLDLEVQFQSQGGHASAPPKKGITGQMGKLMQDLESKAMKSEFTPPVKELFNRLGRHSSFGYRLIFANMWLTKPLLNMLFTSQGGQMNALIRTTTAVTKLEGSKAFNVLPPNGKIGINARLLNKDTAKDTQAFVSSLIKGDHKINVVESREASPLSSHDSDSFRFLEKTILSLWPDAIVSPYLMIAGTDSRHFHDISDHVYRFAPIEITKEELSLIHSNNERMRVETVIKSVACYVKIIRGLS
ncbi:M20/M25/M40 family metallo-hydrolase [Acidaminobacter sp. JC074]|uniref:M20/M25/M40 family metallo-hydrolase n=1 Tax=Acidaminobacter sp. JC074 TaxID=2530199 RepID=UPI001F0F3767|nr:M20/M25/M40 family metallo-hydrolase [Acidaminobacter sp. JC074]MCH4890800.1 M20/M25/M40 family metallo-hydrolase [Acidaminobacter sp. JC074]